MRILHAIHDFLPRHQAGSEIYALNLCQAQRALGLDAQVLCTDDDLSLEHGSLRERAYDGLPITELINNWTFPSFRDSYRSPLFNRQLRHVLETLAPDVLHIHNLLNLSFDLPAIARDLGIRTVATLHDYTLVCASGGQRVHRAEDHVCALIDPRRCSRCFSQHNFFDRSRFGPVTIRSTPARVSGIVDRLRERAPLMIRLLTGTKQQGSAPAPPIPPEELEERLEYVQHVFETTDLFIAPSAHLANEYRRLGLPAEKLRLSDYGFVRPPPTPREPSEGRLRIGFIGTLVWHKGAHILLEAVRALPTDRFELCVFGDTKEFADYSATLRECARGLPVRFMGRFERERVSEVYASLDVLVVPSLWPENSPLVIHEAFMAGLPVIGSRQGGTQDLITSGVNGFLYEAFAPAELAGALRSLIEEPGLLTRLSAGVPEVKSIEQDATDLVGVYQELLRGGRRGSRLAPAFSDPPPVVNDVIS